MKFSVLISLYHAEKADFLRECLRSLQKQTCPADETVIVFDGTISPELEQVVGDFQAALNVKIVLLPENVGLGKALNLGINHCSHEHIFRMDSDDIALPQRFQMQCDFWAQQPEIALLGCQIAEFDALPEQPHATRTVPQHHAQILEFAKQRNPFNHMTVAYKKSAVLAAGGYQHHVFMEDYNLWLRMLAQGFQAANLPETLVLARTGKAMLARRRGWQYVRSEWQLCCLKRALRVQKTAPALYCFVLRSVPRLLPLSCLQKLYSLIRK